MINVQYTSAVFDSSGYAEAARNYICAIAQQPDINLSVRAVSFENWKTDIGEKYSSIINPLAKKKIDPDVNIMHLTPENFPHLRVRNAKNIGLTVWETSKLPDTWVDLINKNLDEVWVPCSWNVQVFKDSGVKIPIKCIPHTFNKEMLYEVKDSTIINTPPDNFVFYSIFQWSARKNPEALLQAYLTEFTPEDKVSLVLKTYFVDNSPRDKEYIKNVYSQIKEKLWLDTFPEVVLIHGSLDREQVLSLHTKGDCFVLPHRAEGWGIPHFEAMALSNLTIGTNWSGNTEFMNKNNSLLVDYNLTPCSGMNRKTYNGKMNWAEPHIDNLKLQMRKAYNLKSSKNLIEDPKNVIEKFSYEKIGNLILKELKL